MQGTRKSDAACVIEEIVKQEPERIACVAGIVGRRFRRMGVVVGSKLHE